MVELPEIEIVLVTYHSRALVDALLARLPPACPSSWSTTRAAQTRCRTCSPTGATPATSTVVGSASPALPTSVLAPRTGPT